VIGESRQDTERLLHRLATSGVVVQEGEGYRYAGSPESDGLGLKLAQVYNRVGERSARQALLRGYMVQVPPRHPLHLGTLLEVLQREGLGRDEAMRLLESEMAGGYVTAVDIAPDGLTRDWKKSLYLPVCLTPHQLRRLRRKGRVVSPEVDGAGGSKEAQSVAETYVVASYPRTLSEPAREHAEREGHDLKKHFDRMGVIGWDGWWWRPVRK